MKQRKNRVVNRRAFLKTSAVLGGGAALAALAPAKAVADSEAKPTTGDGRKKGYQVSQHVRDYYRASRSV